MSSNTATPTPVPASNSSSSTTASTAAAAATFTPTAQVTAQTATSAAAASGTGGTFSSLADFKAKAPAVYKAMMQSIAMNICSNSQDWNNMIVDAMKEGEDNNP